MSLKHISCTSSTINSFVRTIAEEDYGNIVTLENCKLNNKKSIVLGIILKIIDYNAEEKCAKIYMKEVKPDGTSGVKFKVSIFENLYHHFVNADVSKGDRLGFFEPVVFKNTSFAEASDLQYVLQTGKGDCVMWHSKKKSSNNGTNNMSSSCIESDVSKDENNSLSNGNDPCHIRDYGKINGQQNNKIITIQKVSTENKKSIQFGSPNGETAHCGKNQETSSKVKDTSFGSVNKESLILLEKKKISSVEKMNGKADNTNKTASTQSGTNKSSDTEPKRNSEINPKTKKTNIVYHYKNLAKVKSDALLGDLKRVNIIAVVSEITKGLSKTTHEKYTKICKLVDDSPSTAGHLTCFDLHFFMQDAEVIKEIERGDVLRVHRVKVELYNNDVDGRIFYNQDLMLFKSNFVNFKPITGCKNITFPDEDKRRICSLHKWYKEEYGTRVNAILNNITLLCSIRAEGEFNMLCQVVRQPVVESAAITLSVADGSVMIDGGLESSTYDHGRYDITATYPGHLVTDITVFERLDEYSKIKENDYVYFRNVKATQAKGTLHLSITTYPFPLIVDQRAAKVLETERRLTTWQSKSSPVKCINRTEDGSNKTPVPSVSQLTKQSDTVEQDKTMTSQTKLSPSKLYDYFDSCPKPQVSLTNKDTTDKPPEIGKQLRRKLYTANFTDLSEISNEAIEVTLQDEPPNPSNCDVTMEEDDKLSIPVISPDTLSLDNVLEMVENKYCTPKRPLTSTYSKEMRPSEAKRSCPNEKPIESCWIDMSHSKLESLKIPGYDTDRKKISAKKKCVNKQNSLSNSISRFEFNDMSSLTNGHRTYDEEMKSESEEVVDTVAKLAASNSKVVNWLSQTQPTAVEVGEHPAIVDAQLLHMFSPLRRIEGFLMSVVPDPRDNDLDLVSGYCADGCQQMYLYSTLEWKKGESDFTAICPSCIRTNIEKTLKIMFMVKLCVMDKNGTHRSLMLTRENAELFFGCTVEDFVNDEEVRHRIVQYLLDISIRMNSGPELKSTPLIDIGYVQINDLLLIVDTVLKLPQKD